MQISFKSILSVLLLAGSSVVFSQDGISDAATDSSGGSGGGGGGASGGGSSELQTYLQNLGKYFGYDVTQYCTSGGQCSGDSSSSSNDFSNLLISKNDILDPQLNLYNTFLGTLLGTPKGASDSTEGSTSLVPKDLDQFAILNTLATQTFNDPPYSEPSQTKVSVTQDVDQTTYQIDPVSQTMLNVMGTPGNSYCKNNDESVWLSDTSCKYLNRNKAMYSVVGEPPKPDEYFQYEYLKTYLSQVNTNSLITPLVLATDSSEDSSFSSSSNDHSKKHKGLPRETQAQNAANFIRYASGTLDPLKLPKRSDYDKVYSQAKNLSGKTSDNDKHQAEGILSNYFIQLRTYAAQVSVGVSNLYYILSKRMPQKPVGKDKKDTSQALNEFTMATWRLFNPNDKSSDPDKSQWVNKIDKASTATVQKEIAILLAEINYQLYLTRQQQERQLLTESIMLLQNTKLTQPQNTLDPVDN